MERHFAALQKNKKKNTVNTAKEKPAWRTWSIWKVMLAGQHLKSLQNCYEQGWSYTASINSACLTSLPSV